MDVVLIMMLHHLETTRYSTPRKYRRRYNKSNGLTEFERDLQTGEGAWLTEEEFLQKYRMTRENLENLSELVKNHPTFQNTSGNKQAPPKYQIMLLLRYLGTEGSGTSNPNLRHTFRTGRGTCSLYRSRAVVAISSLRQQYIYWPDEEERKLIAGRIFDAVGIPNCVAIADGSLFPLARRPEREDAPDYSGRKFAYSLSTMILCDDMRRIRYYLSGWPGTAHDNRIFQSTKLARRPEDFFDSTQFVLGDSAFANFWYMVSAFKKAQGQVLCDDHEKFNTIVARCRIWSEHTIGILKGRFPWLRSIQNKITEDPHSIGVILKYIEVCVILHNMLVEESIPGEWWADMEDFDPVEICDDELNTPLRTGAANDERRQQLLRYVLDGITTNA